MINRIFNCDLDTGNISDDNDKYKNNMMPQVSRHPYWLILQIGGNSLLC